jgi:protein-tyrosine kinase
MSRIDEALRLSGQLGGQDVTGTLASPSPWDFGTATVEKPARPAPAPAPTPAPDPVVVEEPEPARVLSFAEPTPVLDGFSSKWSDRLATGQQADWMLVEQFRRLAATLHQAQIDAGTRTIMVTSATSGDGKTLTAINLALTLAESYGRKVLLIDADLRRPSIRDVSHLPNVTGLSGGLRAKSDQQLTVLQVTKNLTLLPAGRPDPDPMSSLTSSRMRRILDDAAATFDWVVLDAPPLGGIADANLLSAMVDGALFVIRAGQSKCPLVKNAIDSIGRDRVLGVILNGVESDPNEAYAQTYRHYGAGEAGAGA